MIHIAGINRIKYEKIMDNFKPNPTRTIKVYPSISNTTSHCTQRYADSSNTPEQTTNRLSLPSKSSADLLDFTLEVSELFAGTGDQISDIKVSGLDGQAGDTPLSTADSMFDATSITFLLSSGVPKQTYDFFVSFRTELGLAYNIPLSIEINQNTPATAPQAYDLPTPPLRAQSLINLIKSLPTDPPDAGGLWSNAGIPTYTPATSNQ